MKFKTVHLGAWTLGSTIHLKELYKAMAFQQSSYFSPKEIRAWQKGITPLSIDYIPQAINSVRGVLKNGISFDVLEDGVILLSKDIVELKKDVEHLDQFMKTKMQPFWRNLSSKDVALPKIFTEQEVENPIVIHVEDASESDLEELFGLFGAIAYKRIKLEVGHVWIGEHVVVLNDVDIYDDDLIQAIQYLMFARLYEIQLKRTLDIQRTLWNRIQGIQHRRLYKRGDLQVVRDKALTIQNQATFFKSHSKQMSHFLLWREEFISEHLSDHVLSTIFREFFLSLKSTQSYLQELWEMTLTYSNATVESISLLYSDNQQRELSILQKLFLVSTIVSVLSLGTLAGSRMLTTDAAGRLLSRANIINWQWESFMLYGAVVLLVSSVIYVLLYFAFTKFQQAKHISIENKK